MRLDLLTTPSWEELNEELAGLLGVESSSHLRLYPGLASAVHELVLGTGLFFSHKNQVTVIGGSTWAFEGVLPHLYKMGFQVKVLHLDQLPVNDGDWNSWVDELPKETNMVLWASDHPVTGELFPNVDLERRLAAKRIFSVVIHHSTLSSGHVEPYSLHLVSLSPRIAVAVLGSRVRTPALTVQRGAWNEGVVVEAEDLWKSRKQSLSEAEATDRKERLEVAVKGAESLGFIRGDFSSPRLFDRLVLIHPQRQGQALAEILNEKMSRVGDHPVASGVSRCQQSPIPDLSQWWSPLPSDQHLRGLLVVDAAAALDPQFITCLQGAVDQTIFNLTS